MQINKNANEILKKIVQKRNWHEGKIDRKLAYQTKKNLEKNKVSYEKSSQILELLGWQKINEETWLKK